MRKLFFLLPILLLIQSCHKDKPTPTDPIDYQYLYKRWEQSAYNPTTGVKTYQPYTDSEFSYEFKENGEVIYRYPQLICGNESCLDSLPMRYEIFGTFSLDIKLDILQINLPEIRYSPKWEIIALDANKLNVLEQ